METTKNPPGDNPLWQYMLSTYQQEGVEAALLELQAQGFNVLMLLSLCWVSINHKTLNPSQLKGLANRVDYYLIDEFRTWRKSIKENTVFHQAYKKALNFELMLEQIAVCELYEYLTNQSLPLENQRGLLALLEQYSELIKLSANDKFGKLLVAIGM